MVPRLMECVIRLPPGVPSPTARHVAIILAWYANAKTGLCYPSIKTLANVTGRTQRTIITAIGELERVGFLTKTKRKTRAGTGHNYILSFDLANGEAIAPIGGPNGETIALNRCNNFTSNGETISPEIEKEIKGKCEPCSVSPRAHTFSKITLDDLPGVAAKIGVPLEYVRKRFTHLEKTGWTLQDGKRITPDGFADHTLKWWDNERNKEAYTSTAAQRQPKQYTDKDWELCAECCANFKAGKCAKGCKIPPAHNPDRAYHPTECRGFSELHAKG